MQITADISKILKNVQGDLTFIFDVLSESRLDFVSLLVSLALENVTAKLCGNFLHQHWPQFDIKVFDKIFVLNKI